MSWGRAPASLLAALALGAAAPARAATLWLSIPDDSGPCGFDQLAAALRAGLPDVRVQPGLYDLDVNDVAVALHRDVQGWSLVVRAAGEHELRRKLPPAGEDCVALAQTANFMVQRYLSEVRWTGAQVVVAPVVDKAPLPLESRWLGTAEVGVAEGWTSGTSGLNPALDIDIGARKGPWTLAVAFTLEGQQAAALADDTQALSDIKFVPMTLQVVEGRRLKLGPGTLRLELMPGIQLTQASLAVGNQSQNGNQTNSTLDVTFTMGARVGLEVPLYGRLFGALRVSGRITVPQTVIGQAEIGGLPAQPFESGYGEVDASISLGYLLF